MGAFEQRPSPYLDEPPPALPDTRCAQCPWAETAKRLHAWVEHYQRLEQRNQRGELPPLIS